MTKLISLISLFLLPIVNAGPALSAQPTSLASVQSETIQNQDNKTNDESLQLALKNVSASAHHLQQTVHEIIFEITRQEEVVVGQPNVVGSTVIPAIPAPTGAIAVGGYFPPREKYMRHFAQQAHDLLVMLSEESLSLPFGSESDNNLSANLINIKNSLNNLRSQNDELQKLMAGPTYSNLLIGKQALSMSDELDKLKKLLKDSESRLHKDIKQLK